MMLTRIPSWLASNWRTTVVIASAAGLAAMFRLTRDDNAARPGQKGEKDIQKLADKISKFGRETHAVYPTGDVIVSEDDLAVRLRKPQEKIAKALEKLLGEGKVERARLAGYWKLHSRDNTQN
jgi:hypothetical protein